MDEQPYIRLDQFLKLMGLVKSGGEAKYLIQHGEVQLNGEVETHRSKKLHAGDVVVMGEYEATVELDSGA
ncbi:MAG: RNA-binding S4 domain-containing protein [Anaerolineae bacterium]